MTKSPGSSFSSDPSFYQYLGSLDTFKSTFYQKSPLVLFLVIDPQALAALGESRLLKFHGKVKFVFSRIEKIQQGFEKSIPLFCSG